MCRQGAWVCCHSLRVSHERVGHESLLQNGLFLAEYEYWLDLRTRGRVVFSQIVQN